MQVRQRLIYPCAVGMERENTRCLLPEWVYKHGQGNRTSSVVCRFSSAVLIIPDVVILETRCPLVFGSPDRRSPGC